MRYLIYVVLLTLLFLLGFVYVNLGDVQTRLDVKERELMRLRAELNRKKALIEELKQRVREENIEPLTEREALDRLFGFVDKLKSSYDMKVVKYLRKESGAWVIDLDLSFKPRNAREVVDRLKELVGSRSPIADIKGVLLSLQPEPVVEIKVTLIQPFVGAKNEADKV
ncbi:hypothetical protein [Hydrogenivirga sp.]